MDPRDTMIQAADQARATYLRLRNERGLDHEQAMRHMRDMVVRKAVNLNMRGAALSSFLTDAAHLQGYAAMVDELQWHDVDDPAEEDISFPHL